MVKIKKQYLGEITIWGYSAAFLLTKVQQPKKVFVNAKMKYPTENKVYHGWLWFPDTFQNSTCKNKRYLIFYTSHPTPTGDNCQKSF